MMTMVMKIDDIGWPSRGSEAKKKEEKKTFEKLKVSCCAAAGEEGRRVAHSSRGMNDGPRRHRYRRHERRCGTTIIVFTLHLYPPSPSHNLAHIPCHTSECACFFCFVITDCTFALKSVSPPEEGSGSFRSDFFAAATAAFLPGWCGEHQRLSGTATFSAGKTFTVKRGQYYTHGGHSSSRIPIVLRGVESTFSNKQVIC